MVLCLSVRERTLWLVELLSKSGTKYFLRPKMAWRSDNDLDSLSTENSSMAQLQL